MLGSHILKSTSAIIGLLITVFTLQVFEVIDTIYFCLSPFESNWWRIFTAPLLHGNVEHIVGNTKVLMITLPVLFAFYKKSSWILILAGYLLPMIFVCAIGVTGYGLGISGLVYAVVWFLIFAGLKSKDIVKFGIAMVSLIMYAGSMVGATPFVGPGVGWVAHLGGLLTALILAFLIKDKDK